MLRYADSKPPLPEIGAQLNVETLMHGSVRFEGGRIRVAMNLIDARSERNLWSETYDSNFSNVFGVQSDIATNVANAMSVAFSLEERADVLEQPTGSSEAYSLYLRAWNTGGIGVRNDELLDQALTPSARCIGINGTGRTRSQSTARQSKPCRAIYRRGRVWPGLWLGPVDTRKAFARRSVPSL